MRNNYFSRGILLITILSLFVDFRSISQENDKEEEKLIQFSGLVLTADSTYPIPYTTVKIKETYRGTMADIDGFFTLVVRENDLVQFSSMGFKSRIIRIPRNNKGKKYNIIITLITDTITFKEAMIYPWPSKDKFKEAFVKLELKDDFLVMAKRNLDQREMLRLMNVMAMSGKENQIYALNQMALQATYLGGQTNYAQFPGMNIPIPLSFLNPQAWAQLIKDIRAGKFKRKEY